MAHSGVQPARTPLSWAFEPTGGLEPPTARLQVGCATSCATPAGHGNKSRDKDRDNARDFRHRCSISRAFSGGAAARCACRRTLPWGARRGSPASPRPVPLGAPAPAPDPTPGARTAGLRAALAVLAVIALLGLFAARRIPSQPVRGAPGPDEETGAGPE